MKEKQKDLLNTQESVENNLKQESTFIHKPIEWTPFYVRNMNDKHKWFITIGNEILRHGFETEETALDSLVNEKWNYIIDLILYIVHKTSKESINETLEKATKQLELLEQLSEKNKDKN